MVVETQRHVSALKPHTQPYIRVESESESEYEYESEYESVSATNTETSRPTVEQPTAASSSRHETWVTILTILFDLRGGPDISPEM